MRPVGLGPVRLGFCGTWVLWGLGFAGLGQNVDREAGERPPSGLCGRFNMTSRLIHRLGAEFLGTFWLVFAGCGTAIFAGDRVGYLGVAIAFGLSVLTMAYAVGSVSGGHFNPAVTFGLAVGKRFPWKDVLPYICTQIVAGLIAGGVLFGMAKGRPGFDVAVDGFAANGYADHSPAGYGLLAAFLAEFILTAVFLFVIMGTTEKRAPSGFAPLAIGLTLTLIHLVSIPITNTSVNPARSIAVAFEAGNAGQLWLFIVAPLLGAALAGLTHVAIVGDEVDIVGDGKAR